MRIVRLALVITLVTALLPVASARAEQALAAQPLTGDTPLSDRNTDTARRGVLQAAVANARWPAPPPRRFGSQKGAVIGAIVGGGGAAIATYWAAKNYGENEAGGFCGGCFAQWGAFVIPAGALVGAIVGSLVSADVGPGYQPRPRRTIIAPVVTRRGGAAVVAVRY